MQRKINPSPRKLKLTPESPPRFITMIPDLTLRLFAPPASGENDLSIEDGLMNSYTEIKKLPNIRIRFEPVEL